MRQRTERLLQGLWCFPMLEGTFSTEELAEQVQKKLHLTCCNFMEVGSARHIFTHQIWQMQLYTMSAEASASAPAGYEFIPLEQLFALPLPVAMNAALNILKPPTPSAFIMPAFYAFTASYRSALEIISIGACIFSTATPLSITSMPYSAQI